MNYKFEIEDWLPRFPLQPEYGHYSGEIVTGPHEICNNEQLRQEMRDQFDWGPAVPVDVFVMADGEPADGFATKIGGLPYWPADYDWPTGLNGDPLLFLAQFNFGDSQDLVGTLPGDLLLIFAEDSDGKFEPLHFHWQELEVASLIRRQDVPYHRCSFAPCYGHVFRSVSYPTAQLAASAVTQKYPKCRGKDVRSYDHLPQYHATQIGEAPFLIQRGDDDLPGRMLCTLSSVNPNTHIPYPFINHPEPLAPKDRFVRPEYLMMGDVGCVYVSIDESGDLYWGESCY
jgi:hypothetical protein